MTAAASQLADVQPCMAFRAKLLPALQEVGSGDFYFRRVSFPRQLEKVHAFDVRLFLSTLGMNSELGVARSAAD